MSVFFKIEWLLSQDSIDVMIVLFALLASISITAVDAAMNCPDHCTCAVDAPFHAVNCSMVNTTVDNGEEKNITEQPERSNVSDVKSFPPVLKTTNTYIDLSSTRWNFIDGEIDEQLDKDVRIFINVTRATALTLDVEWIARNRKDLSVVMQDVKAFELSYHIAGSENVKRQLLSPVPIKDTRTGDAKAGIFPQTTKTYTIENLHPRSKFYICLTARMVDGKHSKQYCKIAHTDRGDIETISNGEIDLKIQIGVALGCIFGVFLLSCVSMCVWISKQRCNSANQHPHTQYTRTPVHQV